MTQSKFKFILITLAGWLICLLFFNISYATNSTNGPVPSTAIPMQYNAKVARSTGPNFPTADCYQLDTPEIIIRAQNGVGSRSGEYSSSCGEGYAGMQVAGSLKVLEKHCADPGCYNVLRAIASQHYIICCKIKYVWEEPTPP